PAPRGPPVAKLAFLDLGHQFADALRRRLACRRPRIGRKRRPRALPVARTNGTARFENAALAMSGIARRERPCAFGTGIAGFVLHHLEPDIGEIGMRRPCPCVFDQLHSPALLARLGIKPRGKRNGGHEVRLKRHRFGRKFQSLLERRRAHLRRLGTGGFKRRHGLRRQEHGAAAARSIARNELSRNRPVRRCKRRAPGLACCFDFKHGLRRPGRLRAKCESTARIAKRLFAISRATRLNEQTAKAEKLRLRRGQHFLEIAGRARLISFELRGLRSEKQRQRRRIEKLVRRRSMTLCLCRITCRHRHHAARESEKALLLAALFKKARYAGRCFDEAHRNAIGEQNKKGRKCHRRNADDKARADFIASPMHDEYARIVGKPDRDAAENGNDEEGVKRAQHQRQPFIPASSPASRALSSRTSLSVSSRAFASAIQPPAASAAGPDSFSASATAPPRSCTFRRSSMRATIASLVSPEISPVRRIVTSDFALETKRDQSPSSVARRSVSKMDCASDGKRASSAARVGTPDLALSPSAASSGSSGRKRRRTPSSVSKEPAPSAARARLASARPSAARAAASGSSASSSSATTRASIFSMSGRSDASRRSSAFTSASMLSTR